MSPIKTLIAAAMLASSTSHAAFAEPAEVEFVTDLARVVGCRFLGTVKPPQVSLGSRRQDDFDHYLSELERIAASRGATHLYILNRSAGWGGASAFGSAYACRY